MLARGREQDAARGREADRTAAHREHFLELGEIETVEIVESGRAERGGDARPARRCARAGAGQTAPALAQALDLLVDVLDRDAAARYASDETSRSASTSWRLIAGAKAKIPIKAVRM